MIKAVVFDCFGVLVESTYEPFKQKFLFGDQALIDAFVAIDHLSSRGEMTQEEAIEEFAKLAGLSYQETADYILNNPKNRDLLLYIKDELKSSYKIGLLSNASDDRLSELFAQEDIALFDDIVLSYQVGLAKPDPEIFKLAASRLGVQPNECIFVDDLEKYLVGAQKVGMETLQYKNFVQFKNQLASLFIAR